MTTALMRRRSAAPEPAAPPEPAAAPEPEHHAEPAAPTQTGLVPRTRAALGIAASAVSVGAGSLLRRRKRQLPWPARYRRGVIVSVPRRFNGPPDSANGGYTCGLVADLVDADVVQVSLRSPPPLETEFEVERTAGLVKLLHGETVVADGQPAALTLDPPAAVDYEAAERASRDGFDRWSGSHPFPTCVICGPERGPGDGYRVFPGRFGDSDLFAATWTPDPWLAGDDGLVRPECVWGGLDCPTSAPVANFEQGPPVVLAQLTALIERPVHAERPHVMVSWPIEIDGRKRHAGVALFDRDGELLASARALWIQLRR